jgi:hypothetical protein
MYSLQLKNKNMTTFVDFLSTLNSAKQQSIVWHNQTDVYSTHKTLNNWYELIVDQLDGLVESVAGIYGRPQGYTVVELVDWTSTEDTIKYFQNLYQYVQTARKDLYQETWVQNQIDNIAEDIAQAIYLLTLNK